MGHLPFEGRTIEEIITKIIVVDAPRVRGKSIPKSVVTIVERCLGKDAGDRYETAEDFAEDCRRALNNEPI
ncbi:MAG: hypothetical protein P1V97_38880, partial [Planctomycetota bacterium]|nr:hypothetical protein [Planctomycetota bacterium]